MASKRSKLNSLTTQRQSAGLSIEALARKSVTSDAIIGRLESGGECTNREAQQIADALGVSLATLGQMLMG